MLFGTSVYAADGNVGLDVTVLPFKRQLTLIKYQKVAPRMTGL